MVTPEQNQMRSVEYIKSLQSLEQVRSSLHLLLGSYEAGMSNEELVSDLDFLRDEWGTFSHLRSEFKSILTSEINSIKELDPQQFKSRIKHLLTTTVKKELLHVWHLYIQCIVWLEINTLLAKFSNSNMTLGRLLGDADKVLNGHRVSKDFRNEVKGYLVNVTENGANRTAARNGSDIDPGTAAAIFVAIAHFGERKILKTSYARLDDYEPSRSHCESPPAKEDSAFYWVAEKMQKDHFILLKESAIGVAYRSYMKIVCTAYHDGDEQPLLKLLDVIHANGYLGVTIDDLLK